MDLTPQEDSAGIGTLVASGEWNLCWAVIPAIRMVPGGRVELPTPAFSGPRSTGELPRHRGNSKIVAGNGNDVETRKREKTPPLLSARFSASLSPAT